MTFDDDTIFIQFPGGQRREAKCLRNGIDWPPPEHFVFNGFLLKRISMSALTDEDRAGMTHVLRGALYEIESTIEDKVDDSPTH
jgi:hypothetical protein